MNVECWHELLPAEGGVWLPGANQDHTWIYDGWAAPAGLRCEAWSQAGRQRCPKHAAVVLPTRMNFEVKDSGTPVALCGGHFHSHRSGKGLRIPERS